MYQPLPSPEEMAHWDRLSIDDFGLPGHMLMENASRELFHVLEQEMGLLAGKRVALFAGSGNNGGDAFALARHLQDQGAVCLVLRRAALPEVRILTSWYDYLLLLITVLPFLTGFFLVQRVGDPGFWLLAHILTGELLLVAIPFTKLYHVVGFFLTRMQLGMDYGIKRGGRRGRGIAW